MRQTLLALIVLAAGACQEQSDGGAPTQVDEDARVRDLADASATDGAIRGDGGERDDMGVAHDGGGPGDAGPDSGARLRTVESCEDACDVYEACGRLEEIWGNDRAACVEACNDAVEAPAFPGYLGCLRLEPCDRLRRCVLPERPPPSCAAVCAAIEACDVEFRVPAGDCAAACADNRTGLRMSECGGALVDDGDCDEVAFGRCMLEDQAPGCVAPCVRISTCDGETDLVDCALECMQGQQAEDVVSRLREEQMLACIGRAAECPDVLACRELQRRPIVGEATVDDVCAADADCGFFDPERCPETVDALLRTLADGAVDCFAEQLAERCEEPPFPCFRPAPAPAAGCEEHCHVSDLCGLLPGGQNEGQCLELCQVALRSEDPALIDPLRPLLACAFGPDCPTIAQCQADSEPESTCGRLCAREVECEVATGDQAACVEACVASFRTDRRQAERACVGAAATCEGVARCVPPPPPDCAPICDALTECGLAGADCQRACDNAAFADPDAYLPRLSCLVSTARCDARAACEAGELDGGAACLSWCRARTTCVDRDDPDPGSCVMACGAGLDGDDGLLFETAGGCLVEAGPAAACEDLAACFADFDPTEHFCDPFCQELERCHLAEAATCAEDCAAGRDDAGYLDAAVCTLRGARRGAGCQAAADCTGAEVEPASDACQALCTVRHGCDEDTDTFLCERECIPEPPGTPIRAACAERGECDALAMCLDAPAELPEGCVAACAALDGCDGALGAGDDAAFPGAEACAAYCAGGAVLNPDGFAENVRQCAERVRDAGCDADGLRACFEEPATPCQDGWDALEACALTDLVGGDEAAYLADCSTQLAMNPAAVMNQIQCLVDLAAQAQGDPVACLLGSLPCLLGG